jgi:methionyl-tRNA formyltransferase
MPSPRILVLSDNGPLVQRLADVLADCEATSGPAGAVRLSEWDFAATAASDIAIRQGERVINAARLRVNEHVAELQARYRLIISAHCKQLFPAALVESVRCVNIHPGLNPHNRGLYPQVFSILNGLPCGATIHEMDAALDHGPIIARQEVPIHAWDTSLSVYERVLATEVALFRAHIEAIISGVYEKRLPESEGNVNLKRDFEALRQLRLDEATTFGGALDRLRALSHGAMKNAYFIDPQTGRRVFVRVELEAEDVAPT